MPDQLFEDGVTADAFRFASHWWRSIVGAVDDHQWDLPGLGEWTVRELVAHADRAYRTIVEYVEGDTKDPTEIPSAAAYFRTVLAEQTPHVHIAARGRSDAAARSDWLVATDELADQAERTVAERPGDTIVHLFVGEMRLDQYLATRVVELVVHGLDLSAAIGLPTNPPPEAMRVALLVLVDLADADQTAEVLRLLTGRQASLVDRHVLL